MPANRKKGFFYTSCLPKNEEIGDIFVPRNLSNLHSYLGSLLVDIFIEMQVDMRGRNKHNGSARMQMN